MSNQRAKIKETTFVIEDRGERSIQRTKVKGVIREQKLKKQFEDISKRSGQRTKTMSQYGTKVKETVIGQK